MLNFHVFFTFFAKLINTVHLLHHPRATLKNRVFKNWYFLSQVFKNYVVFISFCLRCSRIVAMIEKIQWNNFCKTNCFGVCFRFLFCWKMNTGCPHRFLCFLFCFSKIIKKPDTQFWVSETLSFIADRRDLGHRGSDWE